MRVSDNEKEGKLPQLSFANSRKSTLAEFCHTLERACEENAYLAWLCPLRPFFMNGKNFKRSAPFKGW